MQDPGPTYSTPDEVEAAAGQLGVADHLRLRRVARIAMHGTGLTDPAELIVEAVTTAYLAASKQGGRRWPKGVPFMAYLVMTIRGIASDARRSFRWQALGENLDSEDDEGRTIDLLCAPSAEDTWADEQERSELAASVQAHFKDDPQILAIIEGLLQGMTAPEIRQQRGMTGTEYDSARRRMRRNLHKLRQAHASNKRSL
jgi:hypothetical protein